MSNQLSALPRDTLPPATNFNFEDLFNMIPQISQESSNSLDPYLLPMLLPDFSSVYHGNAIEDHQIPPEYKKSQTDEVVEDLPNSNVVGYMPLSMLHPYNLDDQKDSGSQNMTFMDQLFLYYLTSQSGAIPVR
jgi:hypothetical protein